MKSIYVCTDYRGYGKWKKNETKLCCELAALSGYLPINPHLFMTRYLHYENDMENELVGESVLEWLTLSDELWIIGFKITDEKEVLIKNALEEGMPIRFFDPSLHEMNTHSRPTGAPFSEELRKCMEYTEKQG